MTIEAAPFTRDSSDQKSDEMLKLLESRRSVAVPLLVAPGPSSRQLRRALTIACRVPDHGIVEPWRFITINEAGKERFAARLGEAYRAENIELPPDDIDRAVRSISQTVTAAPVIVIVVSRVDATSHIPEWEQILSAGAACMNLLVALDAMGFGSTWLTGWAAYSDGARAVIGLDDNERVAGIIYAGTRVKAPHERRRPDLDTKFHEWEDD